MAARSCHCQRRSHTASRSVRSPLTCAGVHIAGHRDIRHGRLMSEMPRQTSQDWVFPILVRHQRFVGRYRPGDAESGIAPQEAAIVLGRIVGAHLVDDLGIRLERAIAVGESLRYEDLVPIGSREHRSDMMAEARGARAYVAATSTLDPAVTRNNFAWANGGI